MSELILEIFSEEIPAGMQFDAAANLKESVSKEFGKNNILFDEINTYVSAQRLVLALKGITFKDTGAEATERKGPRVSDSEEILGKFLHSLGMRKEDLSVKSINNTEYYFAKVQAKIEPIDLVLKRVLEKTLQEFGWQKSMRWQIGSETMKWVRPIRNIMCLYNDVVLNFSFGALTANDISFGHRFLSPGSFKVSSVAQYFEKLKSYKVVLDQNIRKQMILDQIREVAAQKGLQVVEDAELLEEVCGLVEYPKAILGSIEQSFLKLPQELIQVAMKNHQRYFALMKDGKIAPYFIVVSNIEPADGGKVIIAGNERVLTARLRDAEFFFEEDQKTSFESRLGLLHKIMFHVKLGSLFDKAQRVSKLCLILARYISGADTAALEKAALYAKCDLTTNLVNEFPELQGVIGKYYYELEIGNTKAAKAIEEHYLPKGRSDSCPSTIEGAILAFADKLDTLVGLFTAGEKPTSSKDPYALRRQVLGIISIIEKYKIDINIDYILGESMLLYGSKDDALRGELVEFFYNRFKYFLKDKEISQDLIEAVFGKSTKNIWVDYQNLNLLIEFLTQAAGKDLLNSFKRIKNITSACKNFANLDPALLKSVEENALYEATLSAEKAVAQLNNQYRDALYHLAGLSKTIDNFFDNVMVMDEDEGTKKNRLSLLNKVSCVVSSFIDFNMLEG